MPCIPFTTGTLRPRCQTSISSPSSVLYWTAQCASTKGRSRIRTDMTVPGPTVKIVAGCGMRSRRVVGLGHEEITPNAKKDIRNARYFVIVDPGLGNYFAPGRDWQPCNALRATPSASVESGERLEECSVTAGPAELGVFSGGSMGRMEAPSCAQRQHACFHARQPWYIFLRKRTSLVNVTVT